MSEDEVAVVGEGGARRPCSAGDGEEVRDGGADCDETVRKLYHFLDGELTEERRRAISSHLDGCSDCFEALGFETELRRVVADRCRDHVPEPLKERIAEAIRREEEARGRPRTTRAQPT